MSIYTFVLFAVASSVASMTQNELSSLCRSVRDGNGIEVRQSARKITETNPIYKAISKLPGGINSTSYVCIPFSLAVPTARGSDSVVETCQDLYEQGSRESGIYQIKPTGSDIFNVSCDMETDGGGWTVFQRHFSANLSFHRDWIDYDNGFGDVASEHWLGLDKLYHVMAGQTVTLRVDIKDLDDMPMYATYDFNITDAADNYRASFKNYSGNATDSLKYHDGREFSTRDNGNDLSSNANCAKRRKSGFWFNDCVRVNTNGRFWDVEDACRPYARCHMRWDSRVAPRKIRIIKATMMMVRYRGANYPNLSV